MVIKGVYTSHSLIYTDCTKAMIEKLDALEKLNGGPNAIKSYLNNIAGDSDDYISAGALNQLNTLNALDSQSAKLLVSRLHLPCVRRLAVPLFTRTANLQMAARALEEEKKAKPFDHVKHLQAVIDSDLESLIESEAAFFLEDGQVTHLINAANYAREFNGESSAISWLVRATLVAPMHPYTIKQTLETIAQADDLPALEKLADKLSAWNLQPVVAKVYSALVLLHQGNLIEFSNLLRTIPLAQLDTMLKSRVYGLMAVAKEKEGNFTEANNLYLLQNNPDRQNNTAQKNTFIAEINTLETFQFSGKPPVSPAGHFMMLGFPRSGTTLLENALACHPKIETFEEAPTLLPIQNALRELLKQPVEKRVVESEAWHRINAIYFKLLQSLSKKEGASVLIDKLPLRTAYAEFLTNCFPDQRYIFSIRHPYDVVLSCYKQRFSNNSAMEHFKRFEDACILYDFAMQRWFKHFTLDDHRVFYIKYDNLVEDFQNEITRTLKFIGVQWHDDILNFAEQAQNRASSTPSYSKVRQGLKLGVQSSWENYRFLFNDANNKYLDPWVKKFGYEGV